jgi:hypothetical protein
MRGNVKIRLRQPRRDSWSVYSRWQYRPSLEVLDDRVTPSVLTPSPSSAVILPVTASSTSNTIRPGPGAPSSAAYAEELLAADRIAADRSRVATVSPFIESQPPPVPVPIPAPVVALAPRAVSMVHLTGPGVQLATSDVTLALRNVPDQLTVPEGETVTFTAWAGYGRQPASNPRFSLEPVEGSNFPEGAEIDPESGLFRWSPTTGFFAFRVHVQDSNNVAAKVVHLHVEPVMRQAPATDDETLMYVPEDSWADTFDGATGGGSEPVAAGVDHPSGATFDLDSPE